MPEPGPSSDDRAANLCAICGEPVPVSNDCAVFLRVLGAMLHDPFIIQAGYNHEPKHLLPTPNCRGVNTWAQYLPGWPTDRQRTENYTHEKMLVVRRAYRLMTILTAGNPVTPNRLIRTNDETNPSKVTYVVNLERYDAANEYARGVPFPVTVAQVTDAKDQNPSACMLVIPNDNYIIEQAGFCLAGYWDPERTGGVP